MGTLYFLDSDGAENFVEEGVTEDRFFSAIRNDVRRRNPEYKIPYTRTWKASDGTIWFDVGSHTEFYLIRKE